MFLSNPSTNSENVIISSRQKQFSNMKSYLPLNHLSTYGTKAPVTTTPFYD